MAHVVGWGVVEDGMNESIRSAIEEASGWVRQHPDEARYTDSPATARIDSGLRVMVSGPNDEGVTTDMPSAVGGAGSAASPGWLFRASLAACVVSLATMRAAQLGVTGFSCEADVDSESDDRGILGLDDDVPAGPLSIRIAFRMSADEVDGAALTAIGNWAVDHCPVSEGASRAVPIRIEVNS